MAFTRMDQGTKEEWDLVRGAVVRRESGMAARIKSLLLQLEQQNDGFAIDQLQHSLQTATRALRAGASDELIVAALCHDLGAVISVENHAGMAAEILRPYVAPEICEIVRTHQDFQRRHYHSSLGRDPRARVRYAWRSWYAEACRFSDQWDQVSLDPTTRRYLSPPSSR